MNIRFPVEWPRLWRSLTIYLSVAIIVPVALVVGLRAVKNGSAEAFRHVTPLGVGLGIAGVVAFAGIASAIVALFVRAMAVRLTDDFIEGRNYWGLKRRIPLREITGLSRFSSNGIEAIVVASAKSGKIYIPIQTEHLPELVELLGTYLPSSKNAHDSC